MILFHVGAFSQSSQSFEFLNAPVSSRFSGLGGTNVSLADKDVNAFYNNPSLNGDTLNGVASASYHFYVGDIGLAGLAYARKFSKFGFLSLGVQHVSYGSIEGFDPSGNETSEFSPSETALYISKNHQIENYRLGVSFKTIIANYGAGNAVALAVDLGGVFIHPRQQLTVGMVIRNLGLVISDFSSTANSNLPFDVQVGTTFKPEHMPIRFSLTALNLAKGNSLYEVPGDLDDGQNLNIVEKTLSHVNFGAEILIHKNVNLLAGYNYLRHSQLKLENGGNGAGLTFGFSANVKKFEFVFSRSAFVAGNATYSFTLSRNLNSLF